MIQSVQRSFFFHQIPSTFDDEFELEFPELFDEEFELELFELFEDEFELLLLDELLELFDDEFELLLLDELLATCNSFSWTVTIGIWFCASVFGKAAWAAPMLARATPVSVDMLSMYFDMSCLHFCNRRDVAIIEKTSAIKIYSKSGGKNISWT
jgi:hypothetical protein